LKTGLRDWTSQASENGCPASLLAELLTLSSDLVSTLGRILLANARSTQRLEFHGFTFDGT